MKTDLHTIHNKATFTLRSIFGTARIKLVRVPKIGTRTTTYLVVQEPKSGTVPKIERSVNGAWLNR